MRRRNIFAYIDARDLGEMVDCMLKTDGLGFQMFNASNDEHSTALSTAEIVERYYDGVPLKAELSGDETVYSNAKAKTLLGWAPQHSWKRYCADPRG